MNRARVGLAVACLGLVVAARAAPLAAQEPAAGEARGDTARTAPLPGPPMAEAPDAFRISAGGGVLAWPDVEDRPSLSDAGLWGLDVESRVNRFVAFRLSAAYGTATAAGSPPADSLPSVTGVAQYVVDLSAVLRAGLEPLERLGAVPFGTVGLGTVVHDPDAEALGTKSQSAWSFGAGVEVEPLPGPFGLRVEWRRYRVDGEDLFSPVDRTGRIRSADRLLATLFVAL